ncbi:siderophore-interacting protein [Gemmobacter serpentinus]|uniref:siderophore-interacting protein n=1 Tax=Gemmobacter serpentinus TaxID=2652247 RepID=UPI00124C1BC9|nr:siderophore-interacting protein [Gemmobacter serpentinus]
MAQITTHIHLPPEPTLDSFCKTAESVGATVQRSSGAATVILEYGRIEAHLDDASLHLHVSADTPEALQGLREAIDALATAAGSAPLIWEGAAPGAGKTRLIDTKLVSSTRISPSFQRVRLAGDFDAFAKGGLHFRLLLGPEGAPWPTATEHGVDWPGGIDAWHRPPYTVRRISPDADWIDFDIFLHDGGRVTEWCEEVQPGARVMLTGPGGRGVKQAGWLGLIGDETALPVILRAIEAAAPETRGEARLLITDPADAQDVRAPAGLVVSWVPRSSGKALVDLMDGLTLPGEDRFLFFAGGRAEAEMARQKATALGLASTEVHAAAYWTEGMVPPLTQRQSRGRKVLAE